MRSKDIMDFRNKIIAEINSFQAPVEVKRLVLFEIYGMAEKAAVKDAQLETSEEETSKENALTEEEGENNGEH